MTTVAQNVARTGKVLSTSTPDWEYRKDAQTGSVGGVAPWALWGGKLWATDAGDGDAYLTSTDGNTWTSHAVPSGTDNMRGFWAPNENLLLLGCRKTSTSYIKLYYTTNGTTWTPCVNTVGGGEVLIDGAPDVWSFAVSSAGTMCISNYGNTPNEAQIWRSTDGINWTKVLSFTAGFINHFHAIGHHEATGTWFVDTGDGAGAGPMLLIMSYDDGLTWVDWITGEAIDEEDPGSYHDGPMGQTVKFYDDGGDLVLCGSDNHGSFYSFDPDTFEINSILIPNLAAPDGHGVGYGTCIDRYAGLYYFGTWDPSDANQSAVMLVTPDLVNWAIVAKFSKTSSDQHNGALHLLGYLNGKLHFHAHTDIGLGGHLLMDPVSAALKDAVAVTPSHTNMLLQKIARCTHLIDSGIFTYESGGGTVAVGPEIDADGGMDGGACIHMSKTAVTGEMYFGYKMYTFGSGLVQGAKYRLSAWVRGTGKYARMGCTHNGTGGQPTIIDDGKVRFRGNGEWVQIQALIQIAADMVADEIRIKVYVQGLDEVETAEVWIDNWSWEAATSPLVPWHYDDTDGVQGAEVQSWSETLPSTWTLFGTVRLYAGAEWDFPSSGYFYLLSIVKGAAHIHAYWDAAADNWWISAVGNQSSGVRYFQRRPTIRFAIRYTGSAAKLSFFDAWTGNAVTHLTSVEAGDLAGACTITTGDETGANVMPMELADVALYEGAMSDAQVEAKLAGASNGAVAKIIGGGIL